MSSLDLPDAALATYLQAHVPGFEGPLVSTKFQGGQSNPTYRIDAASGTYVLRRKPPGQLLASAHAVDREFRVLSALQGNAVPVARPLHLCTDESVIGSIFYLMAFVDGRIFWDPSLPELGVDDRAATFDALVGTLAALHRVDVAPWAWPTTASPAIISRGRSRAGANSIAPARPARLRRWTR